jgi:hypothetical protein
MILDHGSGEHKAPESLLPERQADQAALSARIARCFGEDRSVALNTEVVKITATPIKP